MWVLLQPRETVKEGDQYYDSKDGWTPVHHWLWEDGAIAPFLVRRELSGRKLVDYLLSTGDICLRDLR